MRSLVSEAEVPELVGRYLERVLPAEAGVPRRVRVTQVGEMRARLLGLVPVMRARGRQVAEGEAIRYLAELAWVPQAMLANRRLEWRELDARSVEVATRVGSTRVALRLEFDAAGDLVGAATDARPRTEGQKIVPTPWAGSYSEFAAFDGIRVPTRADVRWELADGPFTYWRGRLTSFELETPA
jgi:hypothetical protein